MLDKHLLEEISVQLCLRVAFVSTVGTNTKLSACESILEAKTVKPAASCSLAKTMYLASLDCL